MRTLYVWIVAGMLILPGLLQAGSAGTRERATLSSTQTLSFEPRGVIQLERSFGDVEIEGWDRAEVEITTIQSEPDSDPDAVAVTAVKEGEDHLKITTEFASGDSEAKPHPDLKYVIKAPACAKLVVHHE